MVSNRSHAGAFFQSTGCFFYQRQFIKRIDLDGIDAGVYRILDLPSFFAGSVEDDLVACKAGLQRLPKLTAGIDLDIAAGTSNRAP